MNEELSSSKPVYSEEDIDQALQKKKEEIEKQVKEEIKEEVKEQVKEEIEAEHLSEKEELLKEKEEKEAELEGLRKELEGQRSKELSFKILREKAQKAEGIEKEVKELKKQIGELKEEPIRAIKEEFVHENIGDNEEDVKTFNYYYERLKVDAPDRESARKILRDSLLLFQNAKGLLNANPFNKIIGTHGRPGFTEGLTALQKEVFNKFGVTDEMLERTKNAKKEKGN